MNTSKAIGFLFILSTLVILGVDAQTQSLPSRTTDRQVGVIVQRLERSSKRFENSLNKALINASVDQTIPQNDINTFIPDFRNARTQFKDQLSVQRAQSADVQNVLEKAAPINGFLVRHRLSRQVQNDWNVVRNDLNALASAYGVSWQWNQKLHLANLNRSANLSGNELARLIERIETNGDKFRASLTDAFSESAYDQSRREGNMNDAVRAFKHATDQLRRQFDSRKPVAAHVEHLLALAKPIDTYMHSNSLSKQVQNDWAALGRDLNSLASAYNLSANLGDGAPESYNVANRLTGTFRLDSSRSDSPREKAEQATINLPNGERQEVYELTVARLESPQVLSIERRDGTITIASSIASRVAFEADGRERQEELANGTSARITATLRGENLVVSSNGYRENDFTVAFEPAENGRSLRVRRQVDSDRLTQPVVVESIYERTSDVADWTIHNGLPALADKGSNRGEFIVQDGESLVAILNDDLTSSETKQGEKFSLTVTEPGQYEGAVIEGTVSSVEEGGRLTGRAGMSLNFENIWLRNGQHYRFAGTLEKVRTLNSSNVTVDNEGGAQGESQTPQTVKRAGIGTGIGAVIGAIAGGAKGAVIGAVVGAAGGAGSVYVQGKDSLDLPKGTELTIRANAPK
jgi:YmgG-like glycine-zipper protein